MSTSTKLIRNSTAEFLIFTGQAGEQSIEARYEQETVWLTQKLLAELFAVDVRTVSEHLKNIYESEELERAATLRKFRTVQTEGHREVARNIDFYNLDAIISVGYRVNSVRATQFRQWATGVLREFAIKGFVLDKSGCGKKLPKPRRTRVLGSHCQRLPRPRRRTGTAQNPYDHGRLVQATGCIS